jgi:hypothetical protein
MPSTIPNKPMGCHTTLHRPSAILARNETTTVSTPTAESMEKIISNKQSKKDGKQEYLVQCGRGQHELDRTGSWSYCWRDEDDLKMTEEGGVLITTYADELEVRHATRELEVHRAAGAAALQPTEHDTSGQTTHDAAVATKDTTTESPPEVVLMAYLQEEPPRARRQLSRTATIRAPPAGLAAGLATTQASGRAEAAPNEDTTTHPAARSALTSNNGGTHHGTHQEFRPRQIFRANRKSE